MVAAAVVAAVEARGARLCVVDGHIGVAPSWLLDHDLRAEIRANRDALLALVVERDLADPSAHPAAALVRSRGYGEVWLVLDPSAVDALAAEEALREHPRPILRAEDIARLRGKPETAIRAVLETARVWPGARVVR